MDELQQARDFFSEDKFATKAAGIEISGIGEDYAKCTMHVGDIHRNAYGAVMGGALMTLADFTFAVATNFNKPLTVTQTSTMTFLNPTSGEVLTAEATCVKAGRRTCTFTISITDEYNVLVAVALVTGQRRSVQPAAQQ